MKKLTAEKCREQIHSLKVCKAHFGIDESTDYQLQALEIALPILEQQERGEWIEWKGGECPVGYHALVIIRYFDSEERETIAGQVSWNHCGDGDDIIAYRVIPEQPTNQNGEQ
ncbi:hypothetical protein [Pantoea agglomerans]|uniref:hypothetical protein n=1 Tax=Enterobacter agglomerans TaxID=549 RepID=UPI0010C20BCB|nr:hypothetical protein [Pantoea agglomerans]TKK33216.1 hypothetical protein PagCFBP13532_14435 [Pantoea agglomerans]